MIAFSGLGTFRSIAKSVFGPVLLLLVLFNSGPSYALMPIATDCPAELSNDLSLTIPVLSYDGKYLRVDFSVVPEKVEIEAVDVAAASQVPSQNCKPSLLTQDLLLHIPTIIFNGDAYVADFEYAHGLSLGLTGAGLRTNASLYQVLPSSTFQQGCFAPCMCPVSIEMPATGSFKIIEINPERFRENRYSLDDINWTVQDSNGHVLHAITGFGVYRIGGDFALMNQLELEISIDNGPFMHLDSGMLIPRAQFPAISISLDTGTQCFNTLLDITAAPVD